MHRAGLDPLGVLLASTASAAELMGLGEELGRLEPGKRGDLVLLEGDPEDFTDMRSRIRGVWKDGRRVR